VAHDPEPSPVFPSAIRHAYDLLLAGVSLDSIAGTWNAAGLPAGPDGVPAPAGLRGFWTGDRVRVVLSSRDHAGRAVDELAWRRAADLLSAPPRRARVEPDRTLLTAIATCGLCGKPVRSAVVSTGRTAYQCRGDGERIHLARSAGPVDARVRLEVLDRLDRPGAPELLTNRDTPDLHALGAQSAGLRTRLGQIEDGGVDGVDAGGVQAAPRLDAELAAVEDQMTDRAIRDVPTSVTGADPLPDAWDRLAVSRQRGILLALADRIELRPGSPGRHAGDADVLDQTVLITWRA
jgi:site-specific DNA recombinase